MHKALKIPLTIALLLLVAAAIAVAVLLYRPALYLAAVDELVHERYGYRLATDAVEVELSPMRVTVKGFTLSNPAWEHRPLLLEAKTARLQLDPARVWRGEAPYWSLRASGVDVYLEENADGALNWLTDTPDQGGPFMISFDRIRVDEAMLHYRKSGSTRTLVMDQIEANRRGPRSLSMEGSGAYASKPVSLQGRFSLPARRSKELTINLSASGLGLEVNAHGRTALNDLSGTRMEAGVRSQSLEPLEQFLATDLPDAAPVAISLELEGRGTDTVAVKMDGTMSERPVNLAGTIERAAPDDNPGLSRVNLHGEMLGVKARVDGLVNLQRPGQNTDVRVSIRANSLRPVETVLHHSLPELAPLDVSLHIKRDQGAYLIPSLKLEAAGNALSGSGRYAPGARELTANLDAGEIRLGTLLDNGGSRDPGQEQSPNPPEAPLSWQWLRRARADIDLSVAKLWSRDYLFKDVKAAIHVRDGQVRIERIAARIGALEGEQQQAPVLTDRLTLNGTLSPLGKRTQGKDIRLNIEISSPDMSLRVAGEANLNGFGRQSLELDGKARKLDTLAKVLAADIGFLAPAELHAKIESGQEKARIEPLSIVLQNSDAGGRFQLDWSSERLRITGEISSNTLDVDRFQPVEPEDVPKQPDPGDRVFSDEALNLGWMDALALDLAARFGKLTVNHTTFTDVQAKVVLDQQGFLLKPVKGNLTKGGVRGQLSMTKVPKGLEFQTRFTVVNLSPADLGEPGKGFLDGGYTNLDIDVSGRGASPHELAASLNGELAAEIRDSIIRNDIFELIGSDLLTQIVTSINPFVEQDEVTRLQCAALHFTAKDGILSSDEQLALETSKMKVIGGGTINLKNEQLEIGFSPKAQSGIGVSVGTIATFVRLGGTLSNPQPETDPKGLLKSGATIGAAAATGGISLLVQGLIDRVTSGDTACGRIFERTAEVPEAIEDGTADEDSDDDEDEASDEPGSAVGPRNKR